MQRLFFFSLLLILTGMSCKKSGASPMPTTIINHDTLVLEGDRQIRFSLPGDYAIDTIYRLTDDQSNIHKFNIDYYQQVDSAFYTFYSYSQNVTNGTVELYNFTDSLPIAGSLINISGDGTIRLYQSGNLAASFPHKEITLGLRLKGLEPGSALSALYGYLYLYRE